MKTVDFSKKLVGLDRKPTTRVDGKEKTIGEVLADVITLSSAPKKNPSKMLKLAFNVMEAKGPIELEDSDYQDIKDIIEQSGSPVLVKGQIEDAMEQKKKKGE